MSHSLVRSSGASTTNGANARPRRSGPAQALPFKRSPLSETTTVAPDSETSVAAQTASIELSPASSTPPPTIRDVLPRTKGSSPVGTATFILLRLLDVIWQYTLLRYNIGAYLLTFIPVKSVVVPYRLPPGSSPLGLGLSPYHTVIFLLSIFAAFRQIFWILFVSEQIMPLKTAVTIAGFQSFFNGLNTLLSLWSRSSNAPRTRLAAGEVTKVSDLFARSTYAPQGPRSTDFAWTFYAGLLAYIIGMAVETISELQRKAWKSRPENKGKPYGQGLFKAATHINYGGFMLWRAGYATVVGKLSWGLLAGYMHGYGFYMQGIPGLDRYLEGKYGDAYMKIKKQTEWRLLPGIY